MKGMNPIIPLVVAGAILAGSPFEAKPPHPDPEHPTTQQFDPTYNADQLITIAPDTHPARNPVIHL
jgi:hypothetical protein